jgi:hypothetical protein
VTFPTVTEFTDALRTQPLEDVARAHILEGVPYAFRNDQAAYRQLLQHLTTELPIEDSAVRIIGSARIGFSLDPDKFPRPFGPWSDLDIAIISADLFDLVWYTTLKWHYPRRVRRLPEADWNWCLARRKELYWGWFRPEVIKYRGLSRLKKLRPLQELSTRWFDAFQSLSLYPELAQYQASGRLYRSWEHVLMYHVEGLRQLRAMIEAAGGTSEIQ